MRTLFAVVFALLIAQPALAKTVYFCETTAFAEVTSDDFVNDVKPYRFKMAVSSDVVELSGANFIPDLSFNVIRFGTRPESFIAQQDIPFPSVSSFHQC